MTNPIAEDRLTLRRYMQLPTGCLLVSNVGFSPIQPVFAEVVAPAEQRGEQWLRIRASHVDQRLARAFASVDDYHAFLRAFPIRLP